MESHPLKKRKICVLVNDRAIYGRVKPVMEASQKHPPLELQVIAVTNFYFDHLFWYLFHGEPVSFLKALSWYIKARTTKILGKSGEVEKLEYLPKLLIGAGFPIHARLPLFLEGGNTRVIVKSIDLGLDDDFFMRYGRGGSDNFDLHKEFLLVLYHPVTTEYDMNYEYARALCSVIDKIGMQAMFVVSNLDAEIGRASCRERG